VKQLSIAADTERKVVVFRVAYANGDALGTAELTLSQVQGALADLLGAVQKLQNGNSEPGAPGSWNNIAIIDSAEWRLGVRPLDGAITLSLRPANLGQEPLWLTYGFDRLSAENFAEVFARTLAHPLMQGSA
jgi:hypothetical protein